MEGRVKSVKILIRKIGGRIIAGLFAGLKVTISANGTNLTICSSAEKLIRTTSVSVQISLKV